MLAIRLQRTGKKHQPQFRIVLAEKQKSVSKKFIEILGTYNPRNKQFVIDKPERVKYWLDQHVEVSPSIHNLFIEKGILSGEKVQARRVVKKEEPKAAAPTAEDIKTESEAQALVEESAAKEQEAENKQPETAAEEVKPADEQPAA